MAGLGGILAFVIGSLLYVIYRPLPFWVTALIFIFACGLIFWRIYEPIDLTLDEVHPNSNFFQHLRGWFSTISPAHRQSLFFLTLTVFCYMLGFHPIEAFFSSYGVSVLKLSEANSGLVLSAAYITFIVCAIPAGMLANRVGRKRTVFLGLVLFALALLIAFFTPFTAVIVVLMALGGLAWALIDINAFPMVLDISPGADGTTAGIYFIATTLAATVGPVINGWLIDLTGRNYSLIFIIGPVFFLLSFIFMIGVKHGEEYG
jgi:MFS family permease